MWRSRFIPLIGLALGSLLASCKEDQKMNHPERVRWNKKYEKEEYLLGKKPVEFLKRHIDKLPTSGKALDIAAGEGRNAVFLAQHGLQVDAVDISQVGLIKAKALAETLGVDIRTVVADLNTWDLGQGYYDVVANFYYLQRDLTPKIKRSLKPGGFVIYETYWEDHSKLPGGKSMKKEYLLRKGELKEMFSDFEVLVYNEENDGNEAVASIIARKPK